jgi:hypothetical protein
LSLLHFREKSKRNVAVSQARRLLDACPWITSGVTPTLGVGRADEKGDVIMKRMGLWTAILGMLLGAGLAFAGEPKVAVSTGQVVSVDPVASTVVVTVENTPGDPTEVTFSVAKEATINRAGEHITLDGLTAGDKITITFKTVEGKNVATNVSVAGDTEQKPKT